MTESRLFNAVEMTPDTLIELSDYVANAQRQFPGILETAWAAPRPLPPLEAFDSDHALWTALRRYRVEQSIHVLVQDITGHAGIEAVGQRLSAIARSCLTLALASAEQSVAAEHGPLLDAEGEPIRLAVVGLGKLGGDELNFNSDIDVVMIHQGDGHATGRRRLGANQYLSAVAQGLIQRMDSVTEHGRVWAMDTRLRPFGSAGALVWSLPAMETYFLSEGRTWERYAWLKAAHAAGENSTTTQLLDALRPFIYRRYLDYGIFDSLRALHHKIDRQSQGQGIERDIKRGPGGIRTLEFLVQSLQLLEGGRSPELQVAGFLPALAQLERLGQLDSITARQMREAYAFLRTVENRLQAMTGQQTHQLPQHGAAKDRLAALMGFGEPTALFKALDDHRAWVAATFHGQFIEHTHRPASTIHWPPTPHWADELVERGLKAEPKTFVEPLERLAERLAKRPLSGEGRIRLDRLMPELIEKLLTKPQPALGLDDVVALIEQIAQRSAYLALLHERPEITEQVIRVFQASDKIAKWVIDSPQLLDDLIDPTHRLTMPPPPTLNANDPETGLNQLGRWRQTTFLKTALAELGRSISVAHASQQLTDVIETCVQHVLDSLVDDPPLAVIAYGNGGARTMHYTSDLDCVFLHRQPESTARVIKIAQRLISMVQLPLPGGRLVEMDTRLRPNGRAGLLVSHIDQFADYQQQHAWLWEHQALIRARWMAGDTTLQSAFDTIRAEVLTQTRHRGQTAEAMIQMRQKQKRQRQESDIKQRLNDIQFIAEFGVLTQSRLNPVLVDARLPDQQLAELDGPSESLKAALVAHWHRFIEAQHHQWLDRVPRAQDPGELVDADRAIQAAWQALAD